MLTLFLFLLRSFRLGLNWFVGSNSFSHYHSDCVCLLVVDQRNVLGALLCTIEFYTDDTSADRRRVLYTDAICCAASPVGNVKVSPPTRYAGIDAQALALQLKP